MLTRIISISSNLLKFFYSFLRKNKIVTVSLTIISIIYPFVLIVLSWDEIKKIDQINISLIIFSIIFYLVSAIIQFLNWILILRRKFNYFKLDLKIYTQTILMQRLPGGFWQWIGRIQLYNEKSSISAKRLLNSITYERISLILSGGICYLFIVNRLIGITGALFLISILAIWSKEKFSLGIHAILFSTFQVVSYIICWVLGGIILWQITRVLVPLNFLSIIEAISIWSLTGSIGLILFFIPASLGIRELTLSAFLMPQFTFSETILISLFMRIIFFLADIILVIISLLISTNKK